MRGTLASSILVLLVLAGCSSGPGPSPTHAPGPPPPTLYPYATFRCADGANVTALSVEGNGSRCNVRITGHGPRPAGPANELTIAVDPKDPMRLIAGGKDYALGADAECGKTRVWAGQYWSADGGFTWSNDLMRGHDVGPEHQAETPLAGYHCTSDPVAYWDDDGNAYYSGLSYNLGHAPDLGPDSDLERNDLGSNVWLARSADGGRTYPQIFLVAQADGVTSFHDKQWFTYDPVHDALYFTWSLFAWLPQTTGRVPEDVPPDAVPQYTDQVVFSRSADKGATWTPPRVLYESARGPAPDGAPAPELDKQFSMPQVDRDGNVHVIWLTFRGDGRGDLWHTTSQDQGDSWSPAHVIGPGIDLLPGTLDGTGKFRTPTIPVLAIDRSPTGAGHLYVAYPARGGTDDSDVYVIVGRDRGASWSPPMRVNDDNTTRDNFMPWIEVGPRGDVHVLWLDRRDDPKNRLYLPYYAHAAPNATAFDPNVRIGEVPVDPSPSFHQRGQEFIGDYLGITEGPNGWVHPIWVDTREGRADAYTTVLVR